MEELRRNLQESIVLHNLFISIYPKMLREKDKEFFKFVRMHTKTNYTNAANGVLEEVSVNLIKEIMVLLNQVWMDSPNIFDEAMTKNKSMFDSLRMEISNGERFPFNNKEFYKRIREGIAHNSKDVQNFVYNLESFELNLGKVNGEDYIVNFTINKFLKLARLLLENVKDEKSEYEFLIRETGTLKTRDEICEKVKMIDGDDTIDLDDNQIERIFNYFNYIKPGQEIEGNESEIKSILCLPHNAERLLFEKFKALSVVRRMNSGTKAEDLGLDDRLVVINTYVSIITNLLFTIVSTRTNNEILDLLSGTISGLNLDSLCHGRYFHDFNSGFYFYDGRKKLEFQFKLDIKDVNKILDKIAKGNFDIVVMGLK